MTPSGPSASPLPARFYSLDVLRGLGALAVVHTHWWLHFFAGAPASLTPPMQPYYAFLEPLYTHGWRAVDLFFCLSGFIFCWLYAERITSRRIGVGEFGILRLSRLYPLHFATLLLVAVGQAIYHLAHGAFFAIPTNDTYHFLLNLFFLSGLGFEKAGSFNGPVWSVSVEIFLYAIFFAICVLGLRRWWQVGTLALLGLGLEFTRWTAVGRGMIGFFVGMLCFMAFATIQRRSIRIRGVTILSFVTATWLLAGLQVRYDLVLLAATAVLSPGATFLGKSVATVLSHHAFQWLPFQVLTFPATILGLALLETQRGTLGRRLAFLGDISYSSYLLHFPLQLTFASAALALGFDRTIFLSPVTYLLFFATLIVLSLLSYHCLERPAQRFLRQRFSRPP